MPFELCQGYSYDIHFPRGWPDRQAVAIISSCRQRTTCDTESAAKPSDDEHYGRAAKQLRLWQGACLGRVAEQSGVSFFGVSR